ncbi:MAG: DUF6537 domain-containing protein [Phycisphaerales bacterium]
MSELRSSRSRKGHRLSAGAGGALDGVLASEIGVDLVLSSRAEPPPGLLPAFNERVAAFEESAIVFEVAETDTVVAGLLRAGLIAGRRMVAVLTERGLRQALDGMHGARTAAMTGRAAGVVVVFQSGAPSATDSAALTDLARYLGWPVLLPSEPNELSRHINEALRLSQASHTLTMVLVSPQLAGSAETPLEGFDPADRAISVGIEAGGDADASPLLHETRRRRLNRQLNPVAPGETVSLGFVTSGVAHVALRHALHMLGLIGRYPIFKFATVNPADPKLLELALTRCEKLVVVESSGSELEHALFAVADDLRNRAVSLAHVVDWRELGSPALVAVDPHPSELARVIAERFGQERTRDQTTVDERFVKWRRLASASMGLALPAPSIPSRDLGLVHTLVRLLARQLREELAQPAADRPPIDLRFESVESAPFEQREGERYVVEIERRRVASVGRAAIAHAIRRRLAITFLITPDALDSTSGVSTAEVDRLVRSLIRDAEATRATVSRLDSADAEHLVRELREATLRGDVSVLILDAPPPRRPSGPIDRSNPGEVESASLTETWVRPASPTATPMYEWLIRRGWTDPIWLDGVHGPKLDLPDPEDPLATPLDGWDGFEEIRLQRRSAPTEIAGWATRAEFPEPNVEHGDEAFWRVHVCGPSGVSFEYAIACLEFAGRRMGYRVQMLCGTDRAGAFAQLVFSRPRPDEPPLPITARIPYGAGDLIIALSLDSLREAIDPSGGHRVASPERTSLALDLSPSLEAALEPTPWRRSVTVPGELNRVIPPTRRIVLRAGESADRLLNSRRIVGVLLLGVAFQRGYIPVTGECMTRSALRIGDDSNQLASLALNIGRGLALWGGDPGRRHEPRPPRPEALIRRHRRVLAGWPGRRAERRATQFESLALGALDAITGLRRRDAARLAERRFVARLIDCERWGGMREAREYARRVRAVYAAERSVTDYPITRLVIQELARAMLVADPIFVATTMTRPERRRAEERRLRANRAAGDRITMRIWTRTAPRGLRGAFGNAWRLGAKGAWIVALLRPLRHWPFWRSSEYEYRSWVESLVDRCSGELPDRASLWIEIFRQLGRVRGAGVQRRLVIRRVRGTVDALLELGEFQPDESAGPEDRAASEVEMESSSPAGSG